MACASIGATKTGANSHPAQRGTRQLRPCFENCGVHHSTRDQPQRSNASTYPVIPILTTGQQPNLNRRKLSQRLTTHQPPALGIWTAPAFVNKRAFMFGLNGTLPTRQRLHLT